MRETKISDEGRLTTGDYAVMVTGLKRDFNPDDEHGGQLGLEGLLRRDLAALGFRAEDIEHVEVGRECAREAACLRRLAGLHVQRQELQAKRASSSMHDRVGRHSIGLRSDTGDLKVTDLGRRASVGKALGMRQPSFKAAAGATTAAAFLAKQGSKQGSSLGVPPSPEGHPRRLVVIATPAAAPKAWTPWASAPPALPKDAPPGSFKVIRPVPDATSGARPTRVTKPPGPRAPRLLGAWRRVKSKLHLNMHVNTTANLLAGPGGGGAAAAGGPGACARAWRAFRVRRQRQKETRLEQDISEGERQIQRTLLAEHKTTGHAFVVFKEEERRAEFVALFFRPKDFEPYMARLLRRACRAHGL